MRHGTPKLSIVVSFYNEASNIPELLKRLRSVLIPQTEKKAITGYEIILVNDSSTDNSEALIREELTRSDDIVLVNMSRNFGYEECLFAGMAQAAGDAVVFVFADLQDPPEVIPRMLQAWEENPDADVIYTTRLNRHGEHPLKLFITKWGYRVLRAISSVRIPVNSGDFKLLSRRMVGHLLELKEDKPFLRGMISWVGLKQVPVYYNSEARFDGAQNTKFPLLSRRVLYSWLDRPLIAFSDEPLKATLLIGFVLSAISLLYIFVVLFQKIMGWYAPGWPALMCAVLFIGGIQLMMLGFTGLYIGAIFRQTRGRPLYLIKEVLRKGGEVKPFEPRGQS